MTIVKRIFELHNGIVGLVSEPEKMIRFAVRMPMAKTTERTVR